MDKKPFQEGHQTSWQHQPGNVRDQFDDRQRGFRDNSPAGRPEDIPFKKPKVGAAYEREMVLFKILCVMVDTG